MTGVLFAFIGYAQPCDPLVLPPFFGGGIPTYIYCKDDFVKFGVTNSRLNQMYNFSVYRNGVAKSKKGGPLTGNGGSLSVAAYMRSVEEAGEYRITMFNSCADTISFSFYVFSSVINNLSIDAWGSNAVTARWAPSGPRPAVTYEYAVTPYSDPSIPLITYLTTTDTVASATGLTPGATYYIHVRVKRVSMNGDPIGTFNSSGNCSSTNLPWETIRFVSCSGSASIGSVTPANAITCVGEPLSLIATGGNTYKWYDNNNNLISGANSPTYVASSQGQYRAYITTVAGCEGMVYSARVTDTLLHAANFFGGGVYCLGDTVKLGMSRTIASQSYTILKDGLPVNTMEGIGFDLLETTGSSNQSEDTIWYKFKITSAAQAGTYSVRTTNPWCASSLTFGSINVSVSSNPVTSLVAANITDASVNFSWTYPTPWVNTFEYAVTTSATPPASGTLTTNLYAFADGLTASIIYHIHVRPVCGQGSLPWTTISFSTLTAYVLCSSTPVVGVCTPVTRNIPAGTGTWNFVGTYPINSDGGATPGKEKVFTFTPTQTGVYYIDVLAASGSAIHYLYKLASGGCGSTGWTGIRVITATGKYPIGMLQASTQYLFVLDNSNSAASASQTFKICRAPVVAPSRLDECINTTVLPDVIPAFSTKEEYVVDEEGNLIAALDFSMVSVSQSSVSVSYRVDGSVRKDNFNRKYLERSLTIGGGTYSTTSAKVKLFFTDAELQHLINVPDDGIADVTSINDIRVSRLKDYCGSSPYDTGSLSDQNSNGNYDAGSYYIAFNNVRDYYTSTYYLHGGNAALNYYKDLDYVEDFDVNTSPPGWSQKLGAGSHSLTFVTTSSNPTTSPYGQPRFVNWGSYNWSAGNETTLISPPLSTSGLTGSNLKIEFYWYNNNNPSYSTAAYLNEGVQVQYSFNGTDWVNAGAFIPRHDASLPSLTSQWKKKNVALPVITGYDFVYIGFKFRSEWGDNCSMDSVTLKVAPGCDSVISGLTTTSILSNTVNFSWSPVAGVVDYQYKVTGGSNYNLPAGTSSATNASGTYLDMSTTYQLSVRPQCSPGIYGAWSTIPFTTPTGPSYCSGIPVVSVCSPQTVTIPAGTGEWNFGGVYPNNSAGWPTPGKEQLFSFTPAEDGVYYIEILPGSGTGWVDYFYKPDYLGCNNKEWIGIDDVFSTGKRPIGWLTAGSTYLILLDNENTASVTKTFKICKANVATVTANTCLSSIALPDSIPANCQKTEYIIDNNGNLLAGLNFRFVNNSVGNVDLSYYINNGPVRHDVGNKEFLDRNFTVTSTKNPVNYYSTDEYYGILVTLFFTNAELQRLIDEPDDGIADVSLINDLEITRVNQNCSGNISQGLSRFIESHDHHSYDENSSYIGFKTKALGTFFIHGGSLALEADNILCPSAGSTAFSFISYHLDGSRTFQWQVDAGTGFQNISDNNIYSGAITSYLFLNNPPTSYNGYKYRCISAYADHSDTLISTVKTLKFVVTWKGTTSSSWHNASNWDCGVVPDANTDVIIDNTGFSPVVSTNVSCKSVFARQGANITVSPGVKLTITGH